MGIVWIAQVVWRCDLSQLNIHSFLVLVMGLLMAQKVPPTPASPWFLGWPVKVSLEFMMHSFWFRKRMLLMNQEENLVNTSFWLRHHMKWIFELRSQFLIFVYLATFIKVSRPLLPQQASQHERNHQCVSIKVTFRCFYFSQNTIHQ